MVKSTRTHAYDVNVVFEKRTYTEDGASLPYRIYIPKNYDCGAGQGMLSMDAELQRLCRGIRKAFGLSKFEEVLPWEVYLEESLVP